MMLKAIANFIYALSANLIGKNSPILVACFITSIVLAGYVAIQMTVEWFNGVPPSESFLGYWKLYVLALAMLAPAIPNLVKLIDQKPGE